MARVVGYYQSHVIGGATIYYYEKPDDTSKATRIHKGTEIRLPADYASSLTNGMYRIIRPGSGWMFWWNVGDKIAVYETVTDKCVPPTTVSLELSTMVLTIEGGAGGDLNDFSGYGISWRDRPENGTEWGAWSQEVSVTGEPATYNASRPAIGVVRQFRVRTQGTAGSKYYSAYVECANQVTGNSTATPVINFPVNGGKTRTKEPWVITYMEPDPNGEEQTLCRKVDDGEWYDVTICDPNTITVDYKTLKELTPGEHTVYEKLVDASGEESPVVSSTFTLESFEWSRSIEAGDVISNQQISHRKDIEELLETLNVTRSYYGLGPIESLPGVVGRFADWKSQMEAIREGITDINTVREGSPFTIEIPEYPTASTFNRLRYYALLY